MSVKSPRAQGAPPFAKGGVGGFYFAFRDTHIAAPPLCERGVWGDFLLHFVTTP